MTQHATTPTQIPQGTVRDWRRGRTRPVWARLNGTGRLYNTIAETRRYCTATTDAPSAIHTTVKERTHD